MSSATDVNADARADRQRPSGVYKRAYKACEACRRGKSKCELQPTLSDSVCVRCCRERRQCIFPLQRSTKRPRTAKDAGEALSDPLRTDSRSQFDSSSGQASQQASGNRNDSSTAVRNGITTPVARSLRTHGDAGHHPSPRRHPASDNGELHEPAQAPTGPPEQTPGSGDLSETLAKTMVTSSKDAIGLLFQAAHSNDADSKSDEDEPARVVQGSWEGTSDAASPLMYSEAQLPPQLSKETVALWNKHRFVVQGWFSAHEAISYLQFFLDRFAPLSPVADFFYADHDTHKRLILDEPLLCCTILMISSRHLPAHGRAGKTRSSFIHARLWRHIEHLVLRITFGTEKYSSAKSRTLGSIQALLLIVEWHSRLLHFPPEHDGWDAGLAPTVDDSFQPQDRTSETARRWREDVFEPAKRSDRLSWTLVGLAITLAHELGVFDPQHGDIREGLPETATSKTKVRIKRLLYLYSQQLALRLGCPNMFPQGDHSVLQPTVEAACDNLDQAIKDREILLAKWIDVTKLLTTATQLFFSSKTTIKSMLRSNQYISLLEHFQPLLNRWHEDFSGTSLTTIPSAARQVLLDEYYYTRMYINSIALQALVERASQASSGDFWLEQDLLRTERAQDLEFIHNVRESSGQILVITKKLSDDGLLLYLPVRFFLRIVAASIFLLKTIYLGSKGNDAKVALDQLDDAVQALMASDSDDIHLSSRYAELIARHVRRLKRELHIERACRLANAKTSTPQAAGLPPETDRPANLRDSSGPGVPNAHSWLEGATGDATMTGGERNLIDGDTWDDAFWDDWLTQPLDPLIAPFGIEPAHATAGLTSDSLDFLWSSNI